MNKPILLLLLSWISIQLSAQDFKLQDTLVDVGTHSLNFSIVQGTGIPILFESGASNDGSVWQPILEDIHAITGATLITYDRAGFGKSGLDRSTSDLSKHGIEAGVDQLEQALQSLGYSGEIMLVAHSYGGYYAYLYANRNPDRVKALVAVDIVHDYHTEGFAQKLVDRMTDQIQEWETGNPGMFYLLSTLTNAADIMAQMKFPEHIPVTDLLMDAPFSSVQEESDRWVAAHKKFWETHPRVNGILANNTGHYIWRSNPALVVLAISNQYAEVSQTPAIYQRATEYSMTAFNANMKDVYSEPALNSWGYSLLSQDDLEPALKVFELNSLLFPNSFNVYDSLAEALLKAGKTERAIALYEKSIELNPENENAINKLKEIRARLDVDDGSDH
jgi:pimeloyl-ACP methyl ester carboxylesterase